MATPFTFITTHSINEGRLDEYWAQNAAFAEFVAANEPDLLEFGTFMNDEQTEVTFVFGFPDAAAADRHMQVAREKIGQGLEITRTVRLEVLGAEGDVRRAASAVSVAALHFACRCKLGNQKPAGFW